MKNKAWDICISPLFTVITPVYNRKVLFKRTMESVARQTLKNFEYIVIDDGSQEKESIDDIMEEFMEWADFPIMYIKKENGGVHSARNLGTKYGRGELWCLIDSDDCLLEDALEKIYGVWNKIPLEKRELYYVICTRCKDEHGTIMGKDIPDGLNDMPWEVVKDFKTSIRDEGHGACVMHVMKEYPWPEPEGVTFMTEGILWWYLDLKYKSYLTNEVTRIYYRDNAWEHLSSKKRKTIQNVKNAYWESSYLLKNFDIYLLNKPKSEKWKTILRYNTMKHILLRFGDDVFVEKYNVPDDDRRIQNIILMLIAILYSKYYIRIRM